MSFLINKGPSISTTIMAVPAAKISLIEVLDMASGTGNERN
jgi:hypothetical protein